jgi:3-oxoacyl-[acyl-carrier-protein] synthase-3
VVLQYKLGAKNAGTFDVGCACASFPPLIAIGSGLIATNPAIKTILVIGVDMIHRLTDPNDPCCFCLGGRQPARLRRRGLQGRRRLCIRLGHCSRRHLRAGERGRREGRAYADASRKAQLSGNGQRRRWPRLFKRIAAENGFTANDVDQLLFTQISKPSIAIAAERCGARGRMCPFRDASAHARPLL